MRKKLLPISLVGLIAPVGLNACQTPIRTHVAYPPPEMHYTGVSFEVGTSSQHGDLEGRVSALTPDAASVLKPGKRVAFYPPDACRDTTAAPQGASEVNLVGMRCGILMSSLETTAATSGYEVVSWQLLKDKGALEAARSFDIDVLLEVDQYSVNNRAANQSTNLQFFTQHSASNRSAIPVGRESALKCKSFIDALVEEGNSSPSPEEDSVTLAVKAVDVETGRAIWYYQRTFRFVAEDSETSPDIQIYFPIRGTRPAYVPPPPQKYNWIQVLGGGISVIGLSGTIVGTAFTAVQRYPEANIGVGVLSAGLIVTTIGLILIVPGNQKAKRDSRISEPPPAALYPDAEAALCRVSPVIPFWEIQAPSAQPAESDKQFSYDFETQTDGSGAQRRRRGEVLERRAAEDLVKEMHLLAGGGPSTSAETPEPAPALPLQPRSGVTEERRQ